VPASILADVIPAQLFEAMTRYFGDAESVYRYYGVILRAKASVDKTLLIENDPAAFVKAWHNVVLAWKVGKIRKNFDVLLYAAMQRASHDVLAAEARERHIVNFDWLTAGA
jgi:Tfp pilus assembly ATPase PilU